MNAERHGIVGEAAAVLNREGRRAPRRRSRLLRRNDRRFTDCQAAESDGASWPAGRCEDGMAITRSVAMLAAIATAIEKRMTC